MTLPSQPAWDVSERSQSNLHWQRHLRDLLETSQRIWLFCDVFKTSRAYLKKDVFRVTFLKRLEHISKNMSFTWRLWDISKTSLASICDFSKIQKYNTKMILCNFGRVITKFDKIDVGPLERFQGAVHYQSSLPWASMGWYLRENFGKSAMVKV